MFKSPRDVLQINTLGQQLGLESHLKEWYQDATSVPYGHLHIDVTPKTVHSLRYCSNKGSVPTKFYLPAGIESKFLDDEYTIGRYSPNISKSFPKTSKTIHSQLSKRFHSVSERVFRKPIIRRAPRFSEKDVVKYQKEHKKNRIILSSTKVIQLPLLLAIITPFVIKRLT